MGKTACSSPDSVCHSTDILPFSMAMIFKSGLPLFRCTISLTLSSFLGSTDIEPLFAGVSKMNEIKPGDVVKLKSGGPAMTVRDVGNDMSGQLMVYCTWFVDDKPQQDAFPPHALKVVQQ